MKHLYLTLFLLLCMIGGGGHQAKAQRTNYRSYALYLYNIIKYTNWENTKSDTIKVCFVGSSEAVNHFKGMAVRSSSFGKVVTISQVSSGTNVDGYNVIYLSDNRSSHLRYLPQRKKGGPLVVAEREGLAKRGACINFFVDDDLRLRFDVNMEELSARNLKIANRLLNLGNAVR